MTINHRVVSLGYGNETLEHEQSRQVRDVFMTGVLDTHDQSIDYEAWTLHGKPLPEPWREVINQFTGTSVLFDAGTLRRLNKELEQGE
jgi:hypothetical protein